MGKRADALADRIEQGAQSLAAFAEGLSEKEWQSVVPKDGRTVGILVHHVASMYPIEVQLTQAMASGKPIEGVTWDVVAQINSKHSHEHSQVSKAEAVELLRKNGRMAAEAVRQLTDAQLDLAAPISLNSDAPLTTQFWIEDHALRHSFHHLAKIGAALNKPTRS
jgi:DinB superfamily